MLLPSVVARSRGFQTLRINLAAKQQRGEPHSARPSRYFLLLTLYSLLLTLYSLLAVAPCSLLVTPLSSVKRRTHVDLSDAQPR